MFASTADAGQPPSSGNERRPGPLRSPCPLYGIKGDIRPGRRAGVGVGRLQGGVDGAGRAEIIDKDVKKKKRKRSGNIKDVSDCCHR